MEQSFPEKLAGSQVVKKFPAFYRTMKTCRETEGQLRMLYASEQDGGKWLAARSDCIIRREALYSVGLQ
jgi:hypothetical protein